MPRTLEVRMVVTVGDENLAHLKEVEYPLLPAMTIEQVVEAEVQYWLSDALGKCEVKRIVEYVPEPIPSQQEWDNWLGGIRPGDETPLGQQLDGQGDEVWP